MFSSVQGEGPEVGRRTLFIRFAGCNLRCAWCDTPHSWHAAPHALLQRAPGAGFQKVANPLPLADVLSAASGLLRAVPHEFVSFTGGEPLLQPRAVAACAAALRRQNVALHLETQGLHTQALLQAAGETGFDVIAMDWKFASDVRRAGAEAGAREEFHSAHETFLRAAAKVARRVAVKLVITSATTAEEIARAGLGVARAHTTACVILQPVTPFASVREAPRAEELLAQQARLQKEFGLPDVRVIPQTHKLWNAP